MQLNLHQTALATIIGALGVLTFFIFRLLNTPLTILLFAAQQHDWDLLAAASAMKPMCHVALGLEFLLQLYWFSAIVVVAANAISTTRLARKQQ